MNINAATLTKQPWPGPSRTAPSRFTAAADLFSARPRAGLAVPANLPCENSHGNLVRVPATAQAGLPTDPPPECTQAALHCGLARVSLSTLLPPRPPRALPGPALPLRGSPSHYRHTLERRRGSTASPGSAGGWGTRGPGGPVCRDGRGRALPTGNHDPHTPPPGPTRLGSRESGPQGRPVSGPGARAGGSVTAPRAGRRQGCGRR